MQDAPLSPEDQATIDRLIPPPWQPWRRIALSVSLTAALIGLIVLWTGGWLSPNLTMEVSQWGGEGPVTMGVRLTNNGSRTIEIISTETAPGLAALITTVDGRPVPATLSPGSTVEVISTYEVSDCAAIENGDDTFGIEVQFADGPLRSRRQIDFFASELMPVASSWPEAATRYACP